MSESSLVAYDLPSSRLSPYRGRERGSVYDSTSRVVENAVAELNAKRVEWTAELERLRKESVSARQIRRQIQSAKRAGVPYATTWSEVAIQRHIIDLDDDIRACEAALSRGFDDLIDAMRRGGEALPVDGKQDEDRQSAIMRVVNGATEPIESSTIAEILGLDLTTVRNALTRLMRRGAVERSGLGQSKGGGRPPFLYRRKS